MIWLGALVLIIFLLVARSDSYYRKWERDYGAWLDEEERKDRENNQPGGE